MPSYSLFDMKPGEVRICPIEQGHWIVGRCVHEQPCGPSWVHGAARLESYQILSNGDLLPVVLAEFLREFERHNQEGRK